MTATTVSTAEVRKFDRMAARWWDPRGPMRPLHLGPVSAVQVSQDAAPVLFAATDDPAVAVLDALTGQLRHMEKNLGQTPWLLLNP